MFLKYNTLWIKGRKSKKEEERWGKGREGGRNKKEEESQGVSPSYSDMHEHTAHLRTECKGKGRGENLGEKAWRVI